MATIPGSFTEHTFDWNGIREAYVLATENDACNGVAMLFGHLLTNRAQIFSDVRTYWSPEAVKRVTGKELTGLASKRYHPSYQFWCNDSRRFGQSLDAAGNPVMKEPWNLTDTDVEELPQSNDLVSGRSRLFPWGWLLVQLPV